MKFWLLFFILFQIFIGNILSAAELQGLLRQESENEIHLGDTFPAKLEIWPVKENPHFSVEILQQAIQGKKILGLFYVTSINSIGVSEDNQDVAVADLTLTSIAPFKQAELHMLEVAPFRIPIHIKNIGPVGNREIEEKDFIFEDEILSKILQWKSIILIVIVLLLVVLIVFPRLKKIIHKKNMAGAKNRKREEAFNYWKEKLIKAKTRKEIEDFWINKKFWLPLFDVDSEKVKEIDSYLQSEMYRAEWDEKKRQQAYELLQKLKEIPLRPEVLK